MPSFMKSTSVVKELWGHRSRKVFFGQPDNIKSPMKKAQTCHTARYLTSWNSTVPKLEFYPTRVGEVYGV